MSMSTTWQSVMQKGKDALKGGEYKLALSIFNDALQQATTHQQKFVTYSAMSAIAEDYLHDLQAAKYYDDMAEKERKLS